MLRANLAINGIEPGRVKTYMLALSDEEGVMVEMGGAGAARLDDVLHGERATLSKRSVVKIDVEGAALRVLRGAKRLL